MNFSDFHLSVPVIKNFTCTCIFISESEGKGIVQSAINESILILYVIPQVRFKYL